MGFVGSGEGTCSGHICFLSHGGGGPSLCGRKVTMYMDGGRCLLSGGTKWGKGQMCDRWMSP